STESPRNSRRSLDGRPPFSYAKERCVSARTSRSGSSSTPILLVSASAAAGSLGCTATRDSSGLVLGAQRLDVLAAVVGAARGARGVLELLGLAIGARGEVGSSRLPLRPARAGVAARHL